jgi:hypothetical protein
MDAAWTPGWNPIDPESAIRARAAERAADLCAAFGEWRLVQHHLGRGIDEAVRGARLAQAAILCRKLIAYTPAVVRARWTLSVLSVAEEAREAEEEIARYTAAALRAGVGAVAAERLRFIEACGIGAPLRRCLAEQLERLGDRAGAAMLRASVAGPLQAGRVADAERRSRLLSAALLPASVPPAGPDPPVRARRSLRPREPLRG